MNNLSNGTSTALSSRGFASKNQPHDAPQAKIEAQAQSSQGRSCSALEEARALSEVINPSTNTRQTVPRLTSQRPSAEQTFQTSIRNEFITGSGIEPGLFETAITFVSDYESLPGGECYSPLCEALRWEYRRFGQQARLNQSAALLSNEDGTLWQGKLERPRTDAKGKPIKYETPVGNGSKPYLPPLNQDVRQAIARRYNVALPPPDTSFWGWLAVHPEIPIVITEGGKKALCLLSHGYVAIALYGVDGGARTKDTDGQRCKPYLIAELLPFLSAGRQVILAFDQDAEAKTRTRVKRASIRLASLMQKRDCSVVMASWLGQKGKGVDDFIVNQGVAAWTEVSDVNYKFKRRQLLGGCIGSQKADSANLTNR